MKAASTSDETTPFGTAEAGTCGTLARTICTEEAELFILGSVARSCGLFQNIHINPHTLSVYNNIR